MGFHCSKVMVVLALSPANYAFVVKGRLGRWVWLGFLSSVPVDITKECFQKSSVFCLITGWGSKRKNCSSTGTKHSDASICLTFRNFSKYYSWIFLQDNNGIWCCMHQVRKYCFCYKVGLLVWCNTRWDTMGVTLLCFFVCLIIFRRGLNNIF